jgi:hypothetical protein
MNEGGMALRLCDVWRDPVATRALRELRRRYTVAEDRSGLVLTAKAGTMKLFLNELDDLHQWDFVHSQKLRARLRASEHQRESWKRRALVAEMNLLEAALKTGNDSGQNVSDLRYAALKRYLAKQFHPDHAPGRGLEKVVRNEIFKEIWGEVERLQHPSSLKAAAPRSSAH